MIRHPDILLVCALLLSPNFGRCDYPDPVFKKVPFERWLNERNEEEIRYRLEIPHPELSFHQRLVARVDFQIDGREIASRRGTGELIFFVQITAANGEQFQAHGQLDLAKLDDNVKAAEIKYSQSAFVVPGKYRVATAILDTSTGRHSAREISLRVTPPHDFLVNAWRKLPPVEYISQAESPDSWYLPEIQGRLAWASGVQAETRLNVLLNVAVSAPTRGPHANHSGDLAVLLPTLKVLTETGSPSVSEQVNVLDLERRKSVYRQKDVHELDWPRLKESLAEANTASIDVRSLSDRTQNAQFFVSQVRKAIRDSSEPCVLVVLTAPVAFPSGEDLRPISTEGLPTCRVVYIRYRPVEVVARQPRFDRPAGGRGGRGDFGGFGSRRQFGGKELDQLEATLKPLNPKVVDVETPAEIAKALAEIAELL